MPTALLPHTLQSERKAQNKVKNISEPMAKLVLEQTHHRDASVENIITAVLVEVRKHFHIGEIVQYRLSSSKSYVLASSSHIRDCRPSACPCASQASPSSQA